LDAPPTSQRSPRRCEYTPRALSSTGRSLSSFTATVDPSDVTACPGWSAPDARNAAMLSVVPATTWQSGWVKPRASRTHAPTAATGRPGSDTAGSHAATACGDTPSSSCRRESSHAGYSKRCTSYPNLRALCQSLVKARVPVLVPSPAVAK